VFALQEEVIADIFKSIAEQKALQTAPRTIDPVQQTVATAIQCYLNHPDLDRKESIELIRFLNQPMLSVQIRQLRVALRDFKGGEQIKALIGEVRRLRSIVSEPEVTPRAGSELDPFRREDLRLVCFEFLSGG
jgi:hypothetical protein